MLDPKATDFQPDQFDKLVIDEEGQWHRDKEEMLSCNNFSAMYDMPERWNYSLDPENGKMEDILGEEEGHAPTLSVMAKTTRGQQEGVNTWYGKRCVLSGGHTATGGCIVPTSKASNGLWHSVFYALKEWYPDRVLRRYHQLLKGKTRGSIFPLSPDFLELWNKNHFGLRPIRHPTDPKGRMFIQVDFRMAYDFTTGERLEARDRNIPALAHLQTGDVFELVTDGAEKYPLPNFELLELRYAISLSLGPLTTATCLREVFRGSPPGTEHFPVPEDGLELDREWMDKYLVEQAREVGVLSTEVAEKWRLAFAWCRMIEDGWEPIWAERA